MNGTECSEGDAAFDNLAVDDRNNPIDCEVELDGAELIACNNAREEWEAAWNYCFERDQVYADIAALAACEGEETE